MPQDSTLALPRPLEAAPALTGPTDTLVYAAAARPRPFLLATRGCSARGTETRGVEVVELGGRILIGGLGVAGTNCGNVLLAPAQARRELLAPAGTLLETLLVSKNGFIAQWTRPAALTQEIRLTFHLPGTTWKADGPLLRADASDGVRLLQLDPSPSWAVAEEGGQLNVTAVVEGREGESLRLLATADADAERARESLYRLAKASQTQAEAALVALRARRLAIHTGVVEIDDALAWALARLDAAEGREGGLVHELAHGEQFPLDPESRRAWTALGSLASGTGNRPTLAADGPLSLLALARSAEWRGERPAEDMLSSLASSEGWTHTSPALTTAYRAALLSAADAGEPWGSEPSAEDLRARAAELITPSAQDGPAGRRLPTIGSPRSPASDPTASLLAAALELPGGVAWVPPPDDPPPGILRALTSWACLNEGPFERGFSLFRRYLGDGFANGVGLWSDRSRFHDPAAAALIPLVLVKGLLGARIEGYFGRLRLAPRLPPHWTRFAVAGLDIGDATVRMSYELADGRHCFRFKQERGSVPIMLIFEPILAVPPNTRTWVDGTPAHLTLRPVGGRMQASLQLPLDRDREVAVAST